MTERVVDPKHSYAIVVGIEKYALGPDQDLPGAVGDALRFTSWLLRRGVPDENIALFLSPLEPDLISKQRSETPHLDKVRVQPAERNVIRDELTERLPDQQGDLLFVYWGGHGVIDQKGSTRLFYADAKLKDMRNIDFDDLLRFLSSQHFLYSNFRYQILIIDACRNYDRRLSLPTDLLTGEEYGQRREQFLLLATQQGDVAKHRIPENTGLFSSIVLDVFEAADVVPWPPDMYKISEQVQSRFAEVRREELFHQTPVYQVIQRDWDGTEKPIIKSHTRLAERKMRWLPTLILLCGIIIAGLLVPQFLGQPQQSMQGDIRVAFPQLSTNDSMPTLPPIERTRRTQRLAENIRRTIGAGLTSPETTSTEVWGPEQLREAGFPPHDTLDVRVLAQQVKATIIVYGSIGEDGLNGRLTLDIVVSPINWSGRHVRILPGGPHEDHPVHGRADHQDP